MSNIFGSIAPMIEAMGEIDDMLYMIMSEMPGFSLSVARNQMPRKDLLKVIRDVGTTIRKIHNQQLSEPWYPPQYATIPTSGYSWASYLDYRRIEAIKRQKRKGCPSVWLDSMPMFLDEISVHKANSSASSLLHGEVRDDHVFVAMHNGTWHVTGLIDFEHSIKGDPEHELAYAGFYLSLGDAILFRAFLEGYGFQLADLDVSFQYRMMAHFLLCAWSPFQRYVTKREFTPRSIRPGDFYALSKVYWPLS